MKSAFKRSLAIVCLLVALGNSTAFAAIGRDASPHFGWLERFERWAVTILTDVLAVPHG